MMRSRPWLIAATLSLPLCAWADVLQLDLVLFSQPPWISDRDQGHWDYQTPEVPERTDPLLAVEEGKAVVFAAEQSGLVAELQKLQDQGYTLLDQLSLQFEQSRQNQAITWQIQSGEQILVEAPAAAAQTLMGSQWYEDQSVAQVHSHSSIDGWVRAWVDRYLFVEFDIARFVGNSERLAEIRARQPDWGMPARFGAQDSLGSSPNLFANSEPQLSDGGLSSVESWPAEAVDMHRLHERKRLRLNELHYFDHPRIGMLIQITEPTSSPLLPAPQAAPTTASDL